MELSTLGRGSFWERPSVEAGFLRSSSGKIPESFQIVPGLVDSEKIRLAYIDHLEFTCLAC